jgi:pyruvate/2-oxoglutarate dehydrogenase complex dihydrolipoamide acyltransferase (E2) component
MLKREERIYKNRGGDMDSLNPPVRQDEPDITEAAFDLAEEHGLDIHAIEGTGKDGRIVVKDVRELLDAQPA